VAVKFHIEGRLAIVTLARAERLNAISSALLDGLSACLSQAHASDTDVIVLEAEGRAFCAGDDLTELGESVATPAYAQDFVGRLQDITRQIMFGDKLVVCAAQGYIVGGGAAWPLNADFAVVGDDAILFCPEVGFGMYPSGGATYLLEASCGAARAAQILWRAQRVDAATLVSHRIVGSCVPRAELSGAARTIATELAQLPATSRMRIKQQRVRLKRDPTEAAMAIETEYCIASALDPQMRANVIATRGR
jgi:enoyl-CoA hydratase/carnithine racemase